MPALTKDRSLRTSGRSKVGGDIAPAAADTYFAGAMVAYSAGGNLQVATPDLPFAGIVMRKQVVANAGDDLEIERPDWAWMPHIGAAKGDLGSDMQADNDGDLADWAIGKHPAGRVHGVKAGHLRVVFNYGPTAVKA